MRSPNHAAIKELCRNSLEEIFGKLGRKPPSQITLDEQGWVNTCFFADD